MKSYLDELRDSYDWIIIDCIGFIVIAEAINHTLEGDN